MTARAIRDITKREPHTRLSPLYDIERWFEDVWKKPLSMFGPSVWPELRGTEQYHTMPAVDIYEEGNELVMNAELPGMKKDDIKIDLSENILTITGEKERKEKVEREDYYRDERTFGSFVRRFELPGDLDVDKVKAHFEDGILEVRIPKKAEARKHKKIAIQ